jgi:uncharacterized membrane protein YeiH
VVVIMGVMTGVAGGVLRDMLTAEIPLIFRGRELYATAAITGATLYLLMLFAGLPRPLPTMVAIASIVLLRFGSIFFGFKLPALTPRAAADDGTR